MAGQIRTYKSVLGRNRVGLLYLGHHDGRLGPVYINRRIEQILINSQISVMCKAEGSDTGRVQALKSPIALVPEHCPKEVRYMSAGWWLMQQMFLQLYECDDQPRLRAARNSRRCIKDVASLFQTRLEDSVCAPLFILGHILSTCEADRPLAALHGL
jgi:hypothetical protein